MCSVQGPTRPEGAWQWAQRDRGIGCKGVDGKSDWAEGAGKGPGCSPWRREGKAVSCTWRPLGVASGHEEVAVARWMGVGYTGKNSSPGSIRDPWVSLGHRVTKRVKNLAWCQGLCSAQDAFLQLANKLKSTVECPVAAYKCPPGWGRGHAEGERETGRGERPREASGSPSSTYRSLWDSENTDRCPLTAGHPRCARGSIPPLTHSKVFTEHLLWAWLQAKTWEDKWINRCGPPFMGFMFKWRRWGQNPSNRQLSEIETQWGRCHEKNPTRAETELCLLTQPNKASRIYKEVLLWAHFRARKGPVRQVTCLGHMTEKWQGQDLSTLMADTTSCGLSSPPAPSPDEGLSVSEGDTLLPWRPQNSYFPGQKGLWGQEDLCPHSASFTCLLYGSECVHWFPCISVSSSVKWEW